MPADMISVQSPFEHNTSFFGGPALLPIYIYGYFFFLVSISLGWWWLEYGMKKQIKG